MNSAEGSPAIDTAGQLRDAEAAHLIRRARSGEQEALSELIETWRTYLLHVANGSLGEQLQAKFGASDIVQSACLEIHKHFGEFRGDTVAEWKSWLHQLLVRDLQDTRRRFQQSAKRDVLRERALLDEHGGQLDLTDDAVSARAASIAAEEATTLRAALQCLPEEYRTVIRLRNWDELSFPDIGHQMERSEDAARKLWTRAIERLEAELRRITEGAS